MKRIIFRMDDIAPDMNYEKFAIVRDIFLKNDIRPLIGVIPDNVEKKFKLARQDSDYVEDATVWNELKRLQDKHGWEIALHGYRHLKKNTNGGILSINSSSEFAGVIYEEQEREISIGKRLLESKGLVCNSFMAPSHSFDDNTIKALLKNGITSITDGIGVYPYEYKGCIFMPVPFTIFYKLIPFGIFTVCLHPNTMKNDDYIWLEKLIKNNHKCIISFSDGINIYRRKNACGIKIWKVINHISNIIMRASIGLIAILSTLREKLL